MQRPDHWLEGRRWALHDTRLPIRSLMIIGTVLALLVLRPPELSYACSCAPSSPLEARDHADAVIAGRVAAVTEPVAVPQFMGRFPFIRFAPDPDAPIVLTVAVDTVWKGPDAPRVRVLSANPATSQCGVYVTPGASYVIYALQDGPTLRREICQRFIERAQAGDDLIQLGPGAPPSAQAHAPVAARNGWLFAGIFALVLLGILLSTEHHA